MKNGADFTLQHIFSTILDTTKGRHKITFCRHFCICLLSFRSPNCETELNGIFLFHLFIFIVRNFSNSAFN